MDPGGTDGIRQPAVAGAFYPGAQQALRATVEACLAAAHARAAPTCRAIIVPHAGYVYSGEIAAEGFAAARAAAAQAKRIVVLGPAHYVPIRGVAAPADAAFATPLGALPVDRVAVRRLADAGDVVIDDTPHAPEHAIEVELPFLQILCGETPIVPLLVGHAAAGDTAQLIDSLWDNDTLVVVSSDLSHYHDYATAQDRDNRTARAIEQLDDNAIGPRDACGCMPLRGLLIVAKRRGLIAQRLALKNSGDTAGDKTQVVGYGAWALRTL